MSIEFLTELENKIGVLLTTLDDLKAQNAEFLAVNAELKGAVDSAMNENLTLKEESELLNIKFDELKSDADEQRKQNEELKIQLEEFKTDADGQRDKIESASARIQNLLAKLDFATG